MFQVFNRAPLWEMPDNIRPHFLVYSNIFSYISHDMDPISGVASVVAIGVNNTRSLCILHLPCD